jgi:hypothetical protein
MKINISNDHIKGIVLKKLKTEFKNIILKKEYEIEFSIKENKYIIELIKNNKKVIFRKIGDFKENKILELKLNIEKLINYIDRNLLIQNFLKPIKDGLVISDIQSNFYGYDLKRGTEELKTVYDNLTDLIFTCELELKSYDYENMPEMYFYFFGNKVQLIIGNKKSEFVYFSKNIKYEDLKKIIKKLDESEFK